MNHTEYADLAAMRAELLRDYAPVSAQERLLVMEVAAAWQRLHHCRRREELFFDMQRHAQSVETGLPKEKFPEGSEVLMWVEKPQRAYDQILQSIREAHSMFDRAIRRIEDVQERRRKTERRQHQQAPAAAKTSARREYPAPEPISAIMAPALGAPATHRVLRT